MRGMVEQRNVTFALPQPSLRAERGNPVVLKTGLLRCARNDGWRIVQARSLTLALPPSPFAAPRLFPLPLKGARVAGPPYVIDQMSVRLGIKCKSTCEPKLW